MKSKAPDGVRGTRQCRSHCPARGEPPMGWWRVNACEAGAKQSSIIIFGETLLNRESVAEQSVSRESAEAIVSPNRPPSAGRAESGVGTTQISEHIAAEPRIPEMGEVSPEGWSRCKSDPCDGAEELTVYWARRVAKSCGRKANSFGTNNTPRNRRMP